MKLNKIIKQFDWFFYGLLIILQVAGLFFAARAIDKKTDELVEKKHQLLALEKKEQNLITLQQDYYFLEKDIDVLDTVLPNKKRLIDFVDSLEKEASSSGIEAQVSFSDQSIRHEAGGVKSIGFEINFLSTYFKLMQFLKKIEEMPQIVRVEKIIIQSPQGIEAENNIVLQLKCYIDPNF
jgi:Tfp pilus assembly protein PilO